MGGVGAGGGAGSTHAGDGGVGEDQVMGLNAADSYALLTASLISNELLKPVDNTIGFFFLEIYSRKSKLFKSIDATLKKSTLILSARKSIPSFVNAVTAKSKFNFSTSYQNPDKIVVIEDGTDIVEVVSYNLKRDGYKVTSVNRGDQGINLIRNQSPSLVILDLMLPGLFLQEWFGNPAFHTSP